MTLTAFLDLPSGYKVRSHLGQVEKVLGPVQILKKEESEREAIQSEISLTHEEEGGIKMEECSVEGHKHPPFLR